MIFFAKTILKQNMNRTLLWPTSFPLVIKISWGKANARLCLHIPLKNNAYKLIVAAFFPEKTILNDIVVDDPVWMLDASVDECEQLWLQGDEKAWGQGSRELLINTSLQTFFLIFFSLSLFSWFILYMTKNKYSSDVKDFYILP